MITCTQSIPARLTTCTSMYTLRYIYTKKGGNEMYITETYIRSSTDLEEIESAITWLQEIISEKGNVCEIKSTQLTTVIDSTNTLNYTIMVTYIER